MPLGWVEGSGTGQGTLSAWEGWSRGPVLRGREGGNMREGELGLLCCQLGRVRAETIERQSRQRRFVHSLLPRGFLVVVVVLVGLTKSSFAVMAFLKKEVQWTVQLLSRVGDFVGSCGVPIPVLSIPVLLCHDSGSSPPSVVLNTCNHTNPTRH